MLFWHGSWRRMIKLTGSLHPFHNEDSFQQEAYAQPNEEELHRVDELAPKQL